MHRLVCAFALLLAACGGSTEGSGGDGGRDAPWIGDDVDGAAPYDGGDAARDAPPADVVTGRVPVNHRPDGSTCPQQRGPGTLTPGCDYDAGFGNATCKHDSDCTKGTNGRCVVPPYVPLACSTTCSYDECFSDSDCTGNVPCICRTSPTDYGANVCEGFSKCRVDADCGPGGYCSPSGVENCNTGYFCHTPSDACIDDVDCGHGGTCNYDPTAAHWRCSNTCAPPP
jgi:hypothetical protein